MGIDPHSYLYISDVMLYQLSYQTTWEQNEVQMVVVGAHEHLQQPGY